MSAPLVCAIIPARGGSKRIPAKNLFPLNGKPLLAYSIEHVKATPAIGRVVVSTDDSRIAGVAEQYGAEVIRRPPELCGDHASTETALIHALDHLKEKDGYEPDIVALVQATSPLRHRDTLGRALDEFIRQDADSMFSACRLPGYVWRREPDGWRSLNYDYHRRGRHQDTPLDVMENGSFFIFRTRILREMNNRLGGRIAACLVSLAESFELDEPSDAPLLEHLLSVYDWTPPARAAEGRGP